MENPASDEKKATTTGDSFEASAMHDGSRIVHRDKKVSRWLTAALGIPGLLTIVLGIYVGLANATASKPVPEAGLPFVIAAVVALGLGLMTMGVIFGVLRTLVTESAVHIKYGMWGPTIAHDAITSCKVVPYDFSEFGGWGIRRGRKGAWAYVASGTRAVEICYRDGSEEKRVLVGSDNVEATVEAINRARSSSSSTTTKTRVEVTSTDSNDEATMLAEEAEAEAEAVAVIKNTTDAR